MFPRNERGDRRVPPQVYRLLLAAHVVVSGVWLGIGAAKLTLAVAAATAATGASEALYSSMRVVSVAFPPMAVATLVTGVLLSLGTRWGLVRYYWVATKLALTVGVAVTGIALVDRLILQSIQAPSGQTMGDGAIPVVTLAPATLLISLSVAHVLSLGFATVVSVYKPWGKTRFGGRKALRP